MRPGPHRTDEKDMEMPRIHIKPAQVTAVDGNLARPGSNGRVGSRIRRVGLMIGAFAIAATTALGSATPAAAFTVLNASGYPGTSTVPVIAGQAYTRTDSSGAYGAVTFPWRTVSESPAYAAYDQQVCVTFNLVMNGGNYNALVQTPGWYLARSGERCAVIPAASSSVIVYGATYDGLTGRFASPEVRRKRRSYLVREDAPFEWLDRLGPGRLQGVRLRRDVRLRVCHQLVPDRHDVLGRWCLHPVFVIGRLRRSEWVGSLLRGPTPFHSTQQLPPQPWTSCGCRTRG